MTDVQRVHIIDDEPAIRALIETMLQSTGFETVGYASAEAFLESYSPQSRGCLILDLFLGGMSGRDLQRWLIDHQVALPVIFITGHGNVQTAVAALRDGALDYLEKPIDSRRLIEVVRSAMQSETEQFRRRTEVASIEERLGTLTPGEREVLDGLVNGRSYKELAESLDLSYKTVEARRARVLKKMNAKSISELIRLMLVNYGAAALA